MTNETNGHHPPTAAPQQASAPSPAAGEGPTRDPAPSELSRLVDAAGAVIAASFSPLWATRLVSFAGAEVGTALHRRMSVRDQVSRINTAGAPMRVLAKVGGH